MVVTTSDTKMSRVRRSMTNNNGLWIGWLDLLTPSYTVTLSYNHKNSQSMTKTPSIPYWTTSVLSSAVTDLVLIYESVTSSAFVVRWLTLHSWTLHYWTAFWTLLRMNRWWINWTNPSSRVESSIMLRRTVRRPVYLRIKHQCGAYDQIFITVRQLRVCWCGALSLTIGWVCRLQLLLVLASAVLLGSESLGTRNHILKSQMTPMTRRVYTLVIYD
jgi:hypothetical protein